MKSLTLRTYPAACALHAALASLVQGHKVEARQHLADLQGEAPDLATTLNPLAGMLLAEETEIPPGWHHPSLAD